MAQTGMAAAQRPRGPSRPESTHVHSREAPEQLGRHQSAVSARGLRPASNKAIGTPPGAVMTSPRREGLPHRLPEGTPGCPGREGDGAC